jgi:hypothetical protein
MQLSFAEFLRLAAVVATAVSVAVAAYAIWRNWRTGVLQRTSTFLIDLRKEDETKRLAIWRAFPRRWDPDMTVQMTAEEANRLFQVGGRPEEHGSLEYEKWNVARRHLNELEDIAFAYVHRLVDRDILSASKGQYLKRSARYFSPLIEKLRVEYGDEHGWQVIKKALQLMERRRRL